VGGLYVMVEDGMAIKKHSL